MINKKCKNIIGREFWLNGKKKNDVVCLFIEVENNIWYKLFLDDEDYIWKFEITDEKPKASDILGDDKFNYPHVDIGKKYGLNNQRIISFNESNEEKGVKAELKFENQKTIILYYDYHNEIESIFCK